MIPTKTLTLLLATLLAAGALAGCADNAESGGGPSSEGDAPSGTLQQAGSSTVLPIAEAWAEDIGALTNGRLQVVVSGGGSGAGASKLCAGEIDIGDMSRELKESEIETCRANGIEPQTWEVAFDGITVVVPQSNDFVDHLTVEELNHIWRTDNPAQTWADVRPGWPAEEIVLYGPDSDSGTYEYFNEVILDEGAPRSDYTPSADDNVLVQGVSNSRYAIGYFGFAYFLENQDTLKAVPIAAAEGGDGVEPTFETISSGEYTPLSRPVYMVTDGVPEAGTPLHYYLTYAFNEGQEIVPDVGYVALDEETISEQLALLG